MSVNDTDKLLVNNGSKTETITFAQFKDGSVLNPTDLFLVNDGTKTETISWEQIEDELGPKGIVNAPTVLKPADGAGSGDLFYLKSDKIIEVEGGGISTCETDLIESVSSTVNEYEKYLVELGAQSATGSFDGNLVSYSYPTGADNTWTWDYTPKLSYTTIKIHTAYSGTKNGSPSFEVNGIPLLDLVPDYDGTAPYLDETALAARGVTSPLESIKIVSSDRNGNTAVLMGIEIDGTLLVEGSTSTTLTFPSSNGFDCFEPGYVVQDPDDQSQFSKDEDAK